MNFIMPFLLGLLLILNHNIFYINFHAMLVSLTGAASVGYSNTTQEAVHPLPKNFVYVSHKPTGIITDLRYLTPQNFLGEKIDGYKKNVAILTQEAANALYKAAEIFAKDGYKVVIYDAYRPKKAVDQFVRWSESKNYNEEMKHYFLPHIDHSNVFDLGYVARKSGHSRSSTVDLTIIKSDKSLKPINPINRLLTDGRSILFLDDNTVDMGSSFDLFDEASHPNSPLVSPEALTNRKYVHDVMEKAGFKGFDTEWWHFTLKNEPFPDQYFDFDVE
jgi:D-alanyl-D-alanine dipeptidase